MNDILKINCPKCGKEFDAGTAFNTHVDNAKKEQEENIKIEAEKKYKTKLESKDKEIVKAKLDAEKKATIEADKKVKSQLELKDKEIAKANLEKDKEIAKAKLDAEKKATIEADKKVKSQLESKDKEIVKAKLDAEKKATIEADKKVKSQLELKDKEIAKANLEKDKEIAKVKIEVEKKIKNSVSIEFQEAIEKKDNEIESIKTAKKITDDRFAEKIEEIKKMKAQGSMELQGEVQEVRLQDYLEKMFLEDDFEDIGKGVKGGDCIQTINHKDKKNIAKIYFESKDTKIFNEKWPNKLLKDMEDKGILNGIIVCSESCMPADFNKKKSYVERQGKLITIIPMNYPIIHAVVNGIRSILILKTRENKDHEIPAVMKKCWEILSSPKFIVPVKNMMSEITNMKGQLEKDKTSFMLSYSKKEKNINNIKDSLTEMILPLMNLDKNVFPEDILIPQEDIKKLKKEEKDISEENLKPWMNKSDK